MPIIPVSSGFIPLAGYRARWSLLPKFLFHSRLLRSAVLPVIALGTAFAPLLTNGLLSRRHLTGGHYEQD